MPRLVPRKSDPDFIAMKQFLKEALEETQNAWRRLKRRFCLLRPCWVPLLVLGIALISALALNQSREILRRLIEGAATSSKNEQFHWLIAMIAIWLWATANWYGSRLLFDDAARESVEDEKEWQGRLDKYGPRCLGCIPFGFIALGFFVEAARYLGKAGRDPKLACWALGFGLACLVMAYLFWAARGGSSSKDSKPVRLEGVTAASEDRLTQGWIVGLILVDFGLLLILIVWPYFALWLGTLAMLFLAAATVAIVGCWLLHYSQRLKLPLVLMLTAWVVLVSNWNDNHAIRRSKTFQPVVLYGISLEDRFERWCQMIEREYGYQNHTWTNKHPLYIVVAEGGGVRAAYWTAILLGKLENERPWTPANDSGHYYGETDFASHVFAISGVSGGSLGACVFDALLAESHASKLQPVKAESTDKGEATGLNFVERAGEILGQDLLSPAVAGMLFPDGLQRFLPGKLFPDRAAALERGWEWAWWRAMKKGDGDDSNRFGDSFSALWGDQYRQPNRVNSWVPSLFLNGTSVENGCRIITSDLRIYPGQRRQSGQFPQSEDSFNKLAFRPDNPKEGVDHPWEISGDLPLSTAANMSTRFPVVSPAGLFPDGTHIVDGGYFDNSGAVTAWDMIRSLQQYLEANANPNRDSKIVLKVIVIRFGAADPVTKPAPAGRTAFLIDAIAPITTVMNRWSASGRGYQEELRAELPEARNETAVEWKENYYELCLEPKPGHSLPLGWLLSRKAADHMKGRIGATDGPSLTSDPPAAYDPPKLENTMKLILNAIPKKGALANIPVLTPAPTPPPPPAPTP